MWYMERMRWVNELMEIFGLSIPEMAEHIPHGITCSGLDLDQHSEKEIRERFIASLRASRDNCFGSSE